MKSKFRTISKPGTKTSPSLNSVERVVLMLMEAGPSLGYPQSTAIRNSKFTHMRESGRHLC